MRKLKDHPALSGTTVITEWRKHRDARLAIIERYRQAYPRAMQRWHRECRRLRLAGPKHMPKRELWAARPDEIERGLSVTPIYPLNYLQ